MTDDDWLTAAMADTAVVAELLLTLRLSTALPPPTSKRPRPAPPQSWTIHQRRSRTQPLLTTASHKSETTRTSPTTPLSWSTGATSLSTGALPISEPNHNRSDSSRSKVMPPGETTPTKRPKKKKTLAALKEEEAILMGEQDNLKRKVAYLQANFEKQMKENESLMQMKMAILESRKEVNQRKDKIVLPDLNVPAGEEMIMSY